MIPEEQYGFHRGRSTIHAVNCLLEAIQNALRQSKFDYTKAFDPIDKSNKHSPTTTSSPSTQHQCPSPDYARSRSVYRTQRTPIVIVDHHILEKRIDSSKGEYTSINTAIFIIYRKSPIMQPIYCKMTI